MLNTDIVKINNKLTTEMKQIESLLHPIQEERARMDIILKINNTDKSIVENYNGQLIESNQASQAAMKEITNLDKNVIQTILNKFEVENELKRREIEFQKEMINRQISNCVSDDVRYKLLKQLEVFETNLY